MIEAATGSVLGLVELERAFSTVHEGAVYLHLGESYRVLELDLAARAALVEGFSADYYTQAKKETTTAIEEAERSARQLGMEVVFGRVVGHGAGDRLPAQVDPRPGDARAGHPRPAGDDVRDGGGVVPPLRRPARRARAAPEAPRLAPRRRARDDRHPPALGHVRPLGHRRALDEPPLPDRPARPSSSTTATPAASASRAAATTSLEGWVGDTERLLAGCPCADGCPSCVQSPKCGNLNEFLDKAGALTLLRRMLAS